jgi:hypothetical protein
MARGVPEETRPRRSAAANYDGYNHDRKLSIHPKMVASRHFSTLCSDARCAELKRLVGVLFVRTFMAVVGLHSLKKMSDTPGATADSTLLAVLRLALLLGKWKHIAA